MTQEEKSQRIDLGIAIAHVLNPGKRLTCDEIAAYCDCRHNTISLIERRA